MSSPYHVQETGNNQEVIIDKGSIEGKKEEEKVDFIEEEPVKQKPEEIKPMK